MPTSQPSSRRSSVASINLPRPKIRYLQEWPDFEDQVRNSIGFWGIGLEEGEEEAVLKYNDYFTTVSTIRARKGFPDLSFVTVQPPSPSKNRVVGEVKPFWTHRLEKCDIRKGLSKLRRLEDSFVQLFTYMNNYQLKYGFLSNYKTYIFVRRVEDYRYHVSPPISSKQKSPTLRECFTYINYLTGGRSYQYKSDCDWDTIIASFRANMTIDSLRFFDQMDKRNTRHRQNLVSQIVLKPFPKPTQKPNLRAQHIHPKSNTKKPVSVEEAAEIRDTVPDMPRLAEFRHSISYSRRPSLAPSVKSIGSVRGRKYRVNSLSLILRKEESPVREPLDRHVKFPSAFSDSGSDGEEDDEDGEESGDTDSERRRRVCVVM